MNYPKGTKNTAIVKITKKQSTIYSRRGMALEEMINESNEYYITHGIADIHKKPTPITIVDVDYKSRSTAKITEAYFVKASTTDYNGVYKGKYIDFDAKQTNNKTSFPLQNVHEHQIKHLKSILQNGGIGFFIIEFSKLNRYFLIPAEQLISFWDNINDDYGSKTISLDYFINKTFEISSKIIPRLDFLEALDNFLRINKNE
jgi:recombination protein U